MQHETFLHAWGEVLHKNVSQILAITDFSSGHIVGETLAVKKNIIGNINLGQTTEHVVKTQTNLASATTFLIADRYRSHKLYVETSQG